MKKISNLLIMAMLAIGMGLTSCDEQLDNAVVPGVTPGTDEGEVTSITVDLSKIDEKYLDTEKTKLQLTVGDEVTLSFTILPEEMASTEVELTAADATILSIDGLKVKALKEGETKVTAKAGEKTAECTVTVSQAAVDLSTITEDYTAQDGTVLTGALAADATTNIKIADGATVTLKDVTINGTNVDDDAHKHAGITCVGSATIILEGENTVKGFYENYPGISVPSGKTLTIQGTGTLNASSNGLGAGIGSGFKIPCGNIEISGGTITAKGGNRAAGIGGGAYASCGDITISGGTVDATGGQYGAGIGGGDYSTCGSITISGGTVDATGGKYAAGIGGGNWNGTCGTITITSGVTKVTAETGGNARSIGAGDEGKAITVSIDAGANVTATGHALSASVVGEIVGSDGKAYAVADKDYMPSGVTAVAMVAYKSGSNGLAIQLNGSPVSKNWADAKTYAEGLTAVSGGTWRLPSKADWQNMLVGCAVSGDATAPDASNEMNPIAGFKAKIAATGITWQSGYYWSSTESGSKAWSVNVDPRDNFVYAKFLELAPSTEPYVLACLEF